MRQLSNRNDTTSQKPTEPEETKERCFGFANNRVNNEARTDLVGKTIDGRDLRAVQSSNNMRFAPTARLHPVSHESFRLSDPTNDWLNESRQIARLLFSKTFKDFDSFDDCIISAAATTGKSTRRWHSTARLLRRLDTWPPAKLVYQGRRSDRQRCQFSGTSTPFTLNTCGADFKSTCTSSSNCTDFVALADRAIRWYP